MEYALETLEIERGRLARAVRAHGRSPAQTEAAGSREVALRRHRKAVDEAIASLRDPEGAAAREIDPALDLAYPQEALRIEQARLREAVRRLRGTVEGEGVRYPEERIARHEGWIAELERAAALLDEVFTRRARLGFS